MIGWSALSGCTSWIIWMRKPRLNSAVATVAVETVLSFARVASLSFDIWPILLSFRGGAPASNPESRGSGFTLRVPRNDSSINRRLAHRRSKAGFEEIEIAALVGLLDMLGEHPAIAALETPFRLLPFGAALCQLGFRHVEIDGAGADVQCDHVPIPPQRQRAADIGFRRNVQDA